MKHPTEKTMMAVGGSRVLALLAFLTLMFAVPASAQAEGRFVYEACDSQLPGGNPPSSFALENWFGGTYEVVQTCASPGGGIGIGDGVPQEAGWGVFEATIPSTPGGWVESLTLSASAGGFDYNSDESRIGGGERWLPWESWPAPGSGDDSRYFLLRTHPITASEPPWASDTAVVRFELKCPFGAHCQPGAYVVAHYIAATEVDPTPPVINGVEGALVSGDVLRGHQALQAQASDVGGGVRSLELRIDGVPMPGTAIGGCAVAAVENSSYKGLVATSPTPCPSSLSGLWNVDTSAPPFQNGANTVQVCASDFASKGAANTGCSDPQTVQVDNTCTESAVAGGADLSAGFSGGSDHVTVGFGSGADVTGQLTGQSGAPISGATICMESQPAGSQSVGQTVATSTTDSQGLFDLKVKPGANRRLLIGYRHDSFQTAKTLSLGTRARPTINLSRHQIRGGKRIVISGRLPKPDPGEHVLALQGSSEHGHVWLTFKKVTTDSGGNYSTTYRFVKPRRKTGYRVRAVAPAQAGYEYVTGASKAARITVRP